MNLAINNYTNANLKRQQNYKQPQFTGAMDGVLTSALHILDTNEMANAVLIDLGAMVGPRTYYDAKHRNVDAGFETFFREISGTFINCLSAGLLALGISHLVTNKIMPDVKLKPNSWFSDDSVKTLNTAWKNSDEKVDTMLQIAVCDDEKYLCRSLAVMIEEYGEKKCLEIKTDVYYSIGELFSSVKMGKMYQLIFLDIVFSEESQNGVEFAKYIRGEMGNEKTLLIFMSGYSEYYRELLVCRKCQITGWQE